MWLPCFFFFNEKAQLLQQHEHQRLLLLLLSIRKRLQLVKQQQPLFLPRQFPQAVFLQLQRARQHRQVRVGLLPEFKRKID
jgi:hypothetical protein